MQVDIITAAGRTITAEDSDHLAELLEGQAGDYRIEPHGTEAEVLAFDAIFKRWPDVVAAWDIADGVTDMRAVLIDWAADNMLGYPYGELSDFLAQIEDYHITEGSAEDWAASLIEHESGSYDNLPSWARMAYTDILKAIADQARHDSTIHEVDSDLGSFIVEIFD